MRRVCLALLISLGVGCGASEPETTCARRHEALYGARVAPFSGEEAVAGAWLRRLGASRPALCTLTRVAPNWLITAAHCIPQDAPWEIDLSFGPEASKPPFAWDRSGECATSFETKVRVEQASRHPTLDLELLRIDEAGPFVPLTRSVATLGEPVVMVGYGLQEDNVIGGKERLDTTISTLSPPFIEVDGAGKRGACVGDSGGPLLRVDSEGGTEIAGVLSDGSSDCLGLDRYVDLSLANDWIGAHVSIARSEQRAREGAQPTRLREPLLLGTRQPLQRELEP